MVEQDGHTRRRHGVCDPDTATHLVGQYVRIEGSQAAHVVGAAAGVIECRASAARGTHRAHGERRLRRGLRRCRRRCIATGLCRWLWRRGCDHGGDGRGNWCCSRCWIWRSRRGGLCRCGAVIATARSLCVPAFPLRLVVLEVHVQREGLEHGHHDVEEPRAHACNVARRVAAFPCQLLAALRRHGTVLAAAGAAATATAASRRARA